MAYAIIKTGGRQFRVAEGDTIDVDLLDVEPGKTATFGDVLLFAARTRKSSRSNTSGAKVITGLSATGAN
jgi:large subunit ribosomal protein L21